MNLGNLLKLQIFNRRKSSRIRSGGVAIRAVTRSHSVQILKGGQVDKQSAVGSYSFLGRDNYVTKSTIGRYCSIGNNVSIGQGEHDLTKISTSSIFYKDAYEVLTEKACIIEHDVWIGVDAVILRGVTVGIGAVVAANAVVNKDVPPFSIVGGVPAKVIRYRFDKHQIERILVSKWWEHDKKEAATILHQLDVEL